MDVILQRSCKVVLVSLWFVNSLVYAQNNLSQTQQPAININLAIFDHDHIMQVSAAACQARQDIEQKRTEFQKELDHYEQTLRDLEHQLVELQKTLPIELFNKNRENFEARVAETHKIVAERRAQLEESFNSAREMIKEATLKIVTEIAQQQGYQIVFPKSIIFYHSSQALDITQDVLKKLNTTLPRISLNLINKQTE